MINEIDYSKLNDELTYNIVKLTYNFTDIIKYYKSYVGKELKNMSIRKKDILDLELMSYTDIAYEIIKEDKKKYNTPKLFKEVCKLLKLSDEEFEAKIGDFFTALSTDKRFIFIDSVNWDLKENHVVKVVVDDGEEDLTDDIESDEEDDDEDEIDDDEDNDIEDDLEDDYSDDDIDDDTTEDDLKDLTIMDEDELEE